MRRPELGCAGTEESYPKIAPTGMELKTIKSDTELALKIQPQRFGAPQIVKILPRS